MIASKKKIKKKKIKGGRDKRGKKTQKGFIG